ncbi:MAG: response regulator transcription factor [bacterium]
MPQIIKKINVILIEDNRLLRDGWKMILESEPGFEVIGSFGNCEDAFASGNIGTADILVMDINLPTMSGIEGVKILCNKFPELPVVMCSYFEDDENIFNSILAGAVGFIAKKTPPTELSKTLKIFVDGGATISPAIAKKIIERRQQRNQSDEKRKNEILEEDFDLLNLISLGKSFQTIAGALSISISEVQLRIRNIYHLLHRKVVNNNHEK